MREMNKAVLIDIAENAEREKVVGVVKDLISDRENLIAALKVVDTDCKFCMHHNQPVPCQETPTEYLCDKCPHDCICRTCQDNCQYTWRGEVDQNG